MKLTERMQNLEHDIYELRKSLISLQISHMKIQNKVYKKNLPHALDRL